jgi:hypothetical protein
LFAALATGCGCASASAGPIGAFRSATSCFSHGVPGRKTGRFSGLAGVVPSGLKSRPPNETCLPRSALVWTTENGPAPCWTWNIGVLPSLMRLSPASPTNPWFESCRNVEFGMLKIGSGIGLFANGTSTFDVQALSARD